jgi:hypothetical protein
MIAGGNALSEDINKFNRLINIGNKMSKWFRNEFGSNLCREITRCDFSSLKDVQKYIENGSVSSCKIIAEKVGKQAENIIKQKEISWSQ